MLADISKQNALTLELLATEITLYLENMFMQLLLLFGKKMLYI